jgi:regulatory protein
MVHFELPDDTAKKPALAPVTYLPGVFPGDVPVTSPRATPGWHVEPEDVPVIGRARARVGARAGIASEDAPADADERDERDSGRVNSDRSGSHDTAHDDTDPDDADSDDADIDDSDPDGADSDDAETDAEQIDPAEERDRAEHLLLRRLRSRSLSVKEATAVLAGTDIDAGESDEIIERFRELHYIDEDRLADQIVHSHHVRKGLGRSGVEAEMRRRGLDAMLILTKLEELPDDEAERASELAIKRIRQLDRLDDQTVDRRLTGFLLRKGYSSAAVRAAVKAAMASRSGGGKTSGVRFR